MRCARAVPLVVVLLVVAVVAVAATGYVVVLKNGQMIRCKEPLQIEGKNAILTLVTGTIASYPVEHVDLIATERYNQLGLGDAIMVKELTVGTPLPTPTPWRSLGEVATIQIGASPELGTTKEPTPTPTPGIRLQGIAYRERRVDQAFTQFFDDHDLFLYRTSVGTTPDYFFVQVVTDSEREVFTALRVVCESFSIIHRLHADVAPKAVELEMVQTSGKPAGTFRITPEMAASLVEGRVGIEEFYVKNVIF